MRYFAISAFSLVCVWVFSTHYVNAQDDQEGVENEAVSAHLLFLPVEGRVTRKLQFRENADAMLEIDAISVAKEGAVDVDSPIWAELHNTVAQFVDEKGRNKRLHVRFYHSDYSRTRPLTHGFHTQVKRMLADLRMYVVMVDESIRNDRKPWSTYVAEFKQK